MGLFFIAFMLAPLRVHAAPQALPCNGPSGCEPHIMEVTYQGLAAYRLTDGRDTEAVIVPSLGRVVRYGRKGGPNQLWSRPKAQPYQGWRHFGGQVTWLAPQTDWPRMIGRRWPPDAAWEAAPAQVEVLSGAVVRLRQPVDRNGIELIRDISLSDTGELIIRQVAKKLRGRPLTAALWCVTSIPAPEALYVGTTPDRLRHLMPMPSGFQTTALPHGVVKIGIGAPQPWKVGIPAPTNSIAAVSHDMAFIQTAGLASGTYPDGQPGNSLEIFDNGQAKERVLELETLSPLRRFVVGSRWEHTVRWKLAPFVDSSILSS